MHKGEYFQEEFLTLKNRCKNSAIKSDQILMNKKGLAILADYIKVKLATVVEGDPKAPFSIATTPRWRGER